MQYDFKDFYIIGPDYPRYEPNEIEESEIVNTIIQKYLMIIYSNQGDVLGDPDFGSNLLELLYETRVSAEFVEDEIIRQINIYIPELGVSNYNIQVIFAEDPNNFQDIMFVNFRFSDFGVLTRIGTPTSVTNTSTQQLGTPLSNRTMGS